jgi:hypothetical protein
VKKDAARLKMALSSALEKAMPVRTSMWFTGSASAASSERVDRPTAVAAYGRVEQMASPVCDHCTADATAV